MDKRGNPGTNGQPKKKPSEKARGKQKQKQKRVNYSPLNNDQVQAIQSHKQIVGGVVRSRDPMAKYARQCMLPDVVSSVMLPDENEHPRCSRVFKRVVDIKTSNIIQSGDNAGTCIIVIPPDPELPGYTTQTGTTLIPEEPGQLRVVSQGLSFAGSSTGPIRGNLAVSDYITKVETLIPLRQISAGGTALSGFSVSAAQAMSCRISVVNHGHKLFRLTVWDDDGTGWSRRALTTTLEKAIPQVLDFSTRASLDHVAFRLVKTTSDDPYYEDEGSKIDITFTMELGAIGSQDACQMSSFEETHLYKSISPFVVDNQITHARLTSVGALLRNTTSVLNQQGNIMVGRAPPHILSHLSNMSQGFANLPVNRKYVGKAADGGYAWWLPCSDRAQAFAEIDEVQSYLRHEELLVFYLSGLKTDGLTSFTLELVWIVEFYSTKQAFEKLQPPPTSQRWFEMQRVLSIAPAASCNPEHESLFNSILRKGRDAYDHYKEHQALYDGVLLALTNAAKALAA